MVCTRLPATTRLVFAFSCDFPDRPVLVLSAERSHRAAGRFDAADELGHLALHHDEEPGTHAVERHANAFASEFLAPASEITDLLPSRADWKRLMQLKETWGISMQTLLHGHAHCRSCRNTPTDERLQLNRRGWRMQEPGDEWGAEEPVLLRRAIDFMGEQGRTIEDLSDLARISVQTIETIAPPDKRPRLTLD